MHFWKKLPWILCLTCVVALPRFTLADDRKKGQTRKQLEELTKLVKSLKTDLADLDTRLKKMESAVAALTKPTETKSYYPPTNGKTLEEINNKLDKILAKLQAPTTRISQYPPQTTGRIHLLNLLVEDVLFIVNNRNYRVPAGRSLMLEEQTPGTIFYEAWSDNRGRLRQSTFMLSPNQTMTLTAH